MRNALGFITGYASCQIGTKPMVQTNFSRRCQYVPWEEEREMFTMILMAQVEATLFDLRRDLF